jgi:2-polyprenyl-3-methyl-5-hydroxy-6-metoxy-1,4-benzoquinol methylase
VTGPDRQRHWDNVYSSKPEHTLSWFEAAPQASLDMIKRATGGRDGVILDVGGGVSHLPQRLVEKGFADITVLDISKEAIRALDQRRMPSVKGVVADVTDWSPDRLYDVWHDRAVLHFLVEEADRQGYRQTLLRALKPGGHVIIFTFAPTGPERCSGLPVRRYGAVEIRDLMGEDFDMVESFEFDHPTPAGQKQRFHAARLRRLTG